MGRGFGLGHIFGIELRVDWGLFIIFWLVTFSLGAGLFAARHPDWTPLLRWGVAVAAAVLFFGSVLAHELSHALVARRRGLPVDSITLFIFGGIAHMRREPETPGTEFWVAAVGPLTSIVLGIVFTALGSFMARGAFSVSDPVEAFSRVGPLATVLLWLGPINILLGVFNLVPGFPLDGGRILRAALWAGTKNLTKATRWAALGGQLFAWLLIALGVMMMVGLRVPVFGRGLVSGLWLVLIGWFLNSAAVQSYQQLVVRNLLEDVPVARLMRGGVVTVTPDLSVQALVDDFFMRSEQRAFPVVDGDRLLGLACLQDVRRVPRDAWPGTRVADIMTRDLSVVRPDEKTSDALRKLAERDIDQVPVVEDGHLRGMLRRTDIMRWLELQAQPG